MREIKFRLWSIEENRFLIPISKLPYDDIDLMYADGKWYFNDGRKLDPTKETLLEYTGLKDKNGKEIYEGDVVEFPPFNPKWYEGDYLPRQRFTASLESHRLWLKEERFGDKGELLLESTDCEIIGNIYENPELLK